jgi:DNA-binding XRE family transcriptional regulator
MDKEQALNNKLVKAIEPVEAAKRLPKKPMVISDNDTKRLKLIAEKAKKMRIAKKMSYEEFALHAGINRNSYYRFEKSADTGDNYTVALLMTVISGLGTTPADFFKDLH